MASCAGPSRGARATLILTEAHAELLLAACHAVRDGLPLTTMPRASGASSATSCGFSHLEAGKSAGATWRRLRVKHRLRPHRGPQAAHVLRAEAHDVNGAAGFPLEEREVNGLVTTEIFWALPNRQEDRAMPDDALEEMIAEANREHDRKLAEQRREDERIAAITEAYNKSLPRPNLKVVSDNGSEEQEARSPFALRPIQIVDQRAIKHRQWIYGHHLIRGFVTLLIAPGGTGKSSPCSACAWR